MRHFFVDYLDNRDFTLNPNSEIGIEDYSLSLYNLINEHIAKLRRRQKGLGDLILQQGYHLLGFSSFLKERNLLSMIRKRKKFEDFCGLFYEEFGKKLSSYISDLDTTKVKYSEEKDRILNEESPWRILGLSINSAKEECDKVCRILSKKYHPDIGGNHDVFAKINHARDLLEDYVF